MKKSRSYIATPPGASVKEQLINRSMSQKEFAKRMDMSEKHICNFLNGEVVLTPDMARRLEIVLGVPAHFWNNLEAIYREKLQLVKEENEMEEDKKLLKDFPYDEMVKAGLVEETSDTTKRVLALRKYFEVVKLSLLEEPLINGNAYKYKQTGGNNYSLLAYIQKAKIEARNVKTDNIDLDSLNKSLNEIKTMNEESFETFYPELVNLLASKGVALVLLPYIKGNDLEGITFSEKNKIVIGLTKPDTKFDRFWFILFQEFDHILTDNSKKQVTSLQE